MAGRKLPHETIEDKQARLKEYAVLNAETFYHYQLIARASGITDDTLKKYRDEDENFSERLEKARAQFIGKNMRKAKPEFLLERLDPELFKERKEADVKLEEVKPLFDIDKTKSEE